MCVTNAGAQNTTADIIGTVTDTSGAVIPGVTVTLSNTATNVSQTVQTSGSGDYIFTLLIPGNLFGAGAGKGLQDAIDSAKAA
jgi:Carboxypeptidase regulatory-like domain